MRTHRWFWALAAALLASCAGYGAPDEVVYGNAVYTQPSPTADFPSLSGTYYLDPTYRLVEDEATSDPALPASVVSTIDSNMQAMGYTNKAADIADVVGVAGAVGIKVAVLKGTGAVYYPGYWCDYWYYYYCYYDWYYAGSYEFGTVIIDMSDVGSPPPTDGRLPILWTAAIYGVSGGPTFDIPRVQAGIDRAFGQSQYLDTH